MDRLRFIRIDCARCRSSCVLTRENPARHLARTTSSMRAACGGGGGSGSGVGGGGVGGVGGVGVGGGVGGGVGSWSLRFCLSHFPFTSSTFLPLPPKLTHTISMILTPTSTSRLPRTPNPTPLVSHLLLVAGCVDVANLLPAPFVEVV